MKQTEAARAVLIEVLNVLGPMRDELVIVGGWVPDLLYPASNHLGSLDVDLAVSPKAIGGKSIVNSTQNNGVCKILNRQVTNHASFYET